MFTSIGVSHPSLLLVSPGLGLLILQAVERYRGPRSLICSSEMQEFLSVQLPFDLAVPLGAEIRVCLTTGSCALHRLSETQAVLITLRSPSPPGPPFVLLQADIQWPASGFLLDIY